MYVIYKEMLKEEGMQRIRIGIVGYGNIGKGVEKAVHAASGMELAAVFTRRDPNSVAIATKGVAVLKIDDALSMKDKIDVMILCGGSATDLPVQGPQFAQNFNTVDSYDTHAKIPAYIKTLSNAVKNTVAVISAGWDPGLFSIMRALSGAVLPDGTDYTFWGYGVSQGHSDAIRRVEGVKDAIQYSVPIEAAVEAARSGSRPTLSVRGKHKRECYVVAEDGADRDRIVRDIVSMPNYFDEYDTTVTFITEKELKTNHAGMPHGGVALRSGNTGENRQTIEFSLKLDSNPEFTASVLVAYARAAMRLANEKNFGVKTVLDIPLTYLWEKDRMELIAALL